MDPTPKSLLLRLRAPGDEAAWRQFVELYTPVLGRWAQRLALNHADAADLVQDVLLQLLEKLPAFTYDENKTFRGWLRTVFVNKFRESRREPHKCGLNDQITIPDPFEAFSDTEFKQYVAAQAMLLMQRDFTATTWKACWELVTSNRSAATIATELRISEDAVYSACARVLRRLREYLNGMID